MTTHHIPATVNHTRDSRSVDTSPGIHKPDRQLPQEYDVDVEYDGRLDKDAEQARRREAQRGEQGLAPQAGEKVPHPEVGTPYLPEQASSWAHGRWNVIQAEFVDDPRRSVADAHQLVGELMQRIIDGFTTQRNELERQWSSGQEVSTEELRLSLQGYRSFFARLLPAVPTSDEPAEEQHR